MALLPTKIEGKLHSIGIETEREIIVPKKPLDLVNRSCNYFGSSFKGRKEGTRELMGITHKPPIIVDPVNEIFLFPTASPTNEVCAWLSHSHILRHYTLGTMTYVEFRNQKRICIDISKGSFENQLYHTAQLRTIITSRMDGKRSMNFFLNPANQEELIYQHKGEYKFTLD
jgi:competence protein ComK